MNPQTRKNPLDGAKYREQYLSNLRLQASNDQKNQNANMVFKNTGQTPSKLPDTRTTTEKQGDIEALKVDLRSKLTQITDGVIASQIIGELTADQIRFAVDKWGTIEPDMKKQFSSGVPSSAFIAYLNRLIQKFQLTEGVETGLQQSSGNAIIMSNTQILYGLPRPQIWAVMKGILDKVSRQFGIDISPALYAIRENEVILPNIQQSQVLEQLPPELKAEVMTIANDMYNNVASNAEITDLISELNVGLANRDKRYTEKAVNSVVETLTLDDSVLEQKDEIVRLVNEYLKQEVQDDAVAIEGGDDDEPKVEIPTAGAIEEVWEDMFLPNRNSPAEPEYGSARQKTEEKKEAKEGKSAVPRYYSREEWDKLGTRNRIKKAEFLRERLEKNTDLILMTTSMKQYGMNVVLRTSKNGTETKGSRLPYGGNLTNADLDAMFEEYIFHTENGTLGEGLKKKGKMRGCGVAPTKPKVIKPYRQSIAHLVDKPVEKSKPYTQFGRNFINKHRLEGEGIVAYRQPSGNTIPTLPSEKVSQKLAKVVRTLVGKGIPSYEDIASLSKEDKQKLHHICKTCKVDSPAIPKMKGEGEQEEDRFNILRGEIIAGNDSPKIAKEFKVMLMKFMNEGRIPRRQANEILQELLALGH
jgi:hypothetical protein